MKLALTLFLIFMLLQTATVILIWPAWKRAANSYRPMLIFLLVNFLFELLQFFVPGRPFVYFSTSTLQYLFTLLMLIWQAEQWHVFDKRPWLYKFCFALVVAGWIMELFTRHPEQGSTSWYYVISSLGIALMAIEMLNRNMPWSGMQFSRNPVFLFSAGLIFSFSLSGMMDLFTVSLLNSNRENLTEMYYFYISLGILTQVLYIRSVSVIPNREIHVFN